MGMECRTDAKPAYSTMRRQLYRLSTMWRRVLASMWSKGRS